MNYLFTFIISVCLSFSVFNQANAQQSPIKGSVTDASSGETLPGVSVLIKGTNQGTQTDVKGEFSLKAPGNATLVFSYMGYISKEVAVNNQTILNIQLEVSAQSLEQVVVVGYGVQKAKDLTAPIAVVKSEQITKSPTASPMSAIQGTVAGVQVVNTGEPGRAPSVRIRGVGTFNNSAAGDESRLAVTYGQPLYVVDGMLYDDINFLNNSDIQDMSILKDASASAIYGVRAANGVVIITTKKGTLNKPATVTYEGYYGMQKATNLLKMTNSAQYAQMIKESGASMGSINNSIALWGADANGYPKTNTNWFDEMLRTGAVQSHNLDVSGGTQKATYSFGFSYLDQEGIMNVKNDYERFNLKAKADYQATDFLKLGVNLIVSNSTQWIPNSNAFQSAFANPSIYPVYDNSETSKAYPIPFVDPSVLGMPEFFWNPMSVATYTNANQKENTNRIMPSFYGELSLLKNKLVLRSAYNKDLSYAKRRNYTPQYYLGGSHLRNTSELRKENNDYLNYVWDNTLTYRDNYKKHNYSAMLGISAREDTWKQEWIQAQNVPYGGDEYFYIHNGNTTGREMDDNGYRYRGLSYFGRITYDYDGRYLLSATMRADGNSKYHYKWGYFPSIGLGWVATREDFMQNQKVFDFMKLRASWGQLGNDKVAASSGFSTANPANSGVFGNTREPGYGLMPYYSWLKWEVVEEFDLGFDTKMLDSRLSFEFDYYHRLTKNAVINNRVPLVPELILKNNGKILNTGIEVTTGWTDKIGTNFNYFANLNLSTLKNEIRDLAGQANIRGGSSEYPRISMVGESINAFYGYQQAGVYQNQAEIDNDPVAKKLNETAPGTIKPGYLKFVDQNGDNVLDANDRVILGSYLPKFTYGFNFGFSYKSFDFATTLQGQTGATMQNLKRTQRRFQSTLNFDEAQFNNRWTGEGTSNLYPSAAGIIDPWNNQSSSFFVESANYFRIQNIQAGYTIDNRLIKGLKKGSARIYVTAERPFTSFSANTFSPEVAHNQGEDIYVYPISALYTFGIKLTY